MFVFLLRTTEPRRKQQRHSRHSYEQRASRSAEPGITSHSAAPWQVFQWRGTSETRECTLIHWHWEPTLVVYLSVHVSNLCSFVCCVGCNSIAQFLSKVNLCYLIQTNTPFRLGQLHYTYAQLTNQFKCAKHQFLRPHNVFSSPPLPHYHSTTHPPKTTPHTPATHTTVLLVVSSCALRLRNSHIISSSFVNHFSVCFVFPVRHISLSWRLLLVYGAISNYIHSSLGTYNVVSIFDIYICIQIHSARTICSLCFLFEFHLCWFFNFYHISRASSLTLWFS